MKSVSNNMLEKSYFFVFLQIHSECLEISSLIVGNYQKKRKINWNALSNSYNLN